MRGAVQSVFYPDLIIREIPVAQPSVIVPYFNLSDASIGDGDEGSTVEEGSVNYGTKNVILRKRQKGIKITYEAIEFNTLDLAAIFFHDLGRLLGNRLNGDCVNAIVNGDLADLSEAASVIGVQDTTKGFQYIDVITVWVRLGLLGRMSSSILGNETTANSYLNLTEVKNRQFNGVPLLETRTKTPLPTQQDLYVSVQVPANQLVFQDSSMSMAQLTARPLMVETEKIIHKQLAGTYASIITGFTKLQRNASVVIDQTLAFSGHGFPTWMSPFNS
jgi:hypothetical protein